MGLGCLGRIDRLISTTDVVFIKWLVKQQAGEGTTSEVHTCDRTRFIDHAGYIHGSDKESIRTNP